MNRILPFFAYYSFSMLFCNQLVNIEEHKKKFIAKITTDASKYSHPSYPFSRVILTVTADDSDYIPKVPDAGQVFTKNEVTYQIMHNGMKIVKDCYYGSWMTDVIYGLKGHHEPQEEKVFYEILKYIPENATMIELGAYWAYYSLWFATAIKGANNYMIEPSLDWLNVGKNNFKLNNKLGKFFHGYVPFNSDKFDNALPIFIDTFIKNNKIEHVNILHSDIQGAEYSMLQTCIESIKSNKIDYFFVSTHSDGIHNSCLNFFKKHNYHIICEHLMSESCSVDGLIVARRQNINGPDKISIKKYRQKK